MSSPSNYEQPPPDLTFELVNKHTSVLQQEWLWEDMIALDEVCFLCADSFAGKSALAVGLACAAGTGELFLGKQMRKCSVLYMSFERHAETIRRILGQRTATDTKVAVSPGHPITDHDWLEVIYNAIKDISRSTGLDVELVIIDTLARSAPGLDENSTRDVGRVLDVLTELAEIGIAVVVLHHHSKGGSDIRGSSAIAGAADRLLTINAKGDDRYVKVTRANSGIAGETVWFKLVPNEYEFDREAGERGRVVGVAECERRNSEAANAALTSKVSEFANTVLQWLESNAEGGAINRATATRSMLENKIHGGSTTAARRAIDRAYKRLENEGLIEVCDDDILLTGDTAKRLGASKDTGQTGTPP